jgi:hypothetical protein
MKNNYKVAGAISVLLGVLALAVSPVMPGPPPFPDDGSGGNIASNLVPGPMPFPDDGAGGNIA